VSGYFDNAEAQDFDLIPAGEYLAEIEDCVVGESRASNKPQIRVQFRILTEAPGATNRVTSDWLTFTDKAASLNLGKITAAGVELPAGWTPDASGLDRLSGKLMHKRAKLVIRHETYNEETRDKIKAWKSTGAAQKGSDPLEAALKTKAGATRDPHPVADDTDDIPF
jgi:hypothetical protein